MKASQRRIIYFGCVLAISILSSAAASLDSEAIAGEVSDSQGTSSRRLHARPTNLPIKAVIKRPTKSPIKTPTKKGVKANIKAPIKVSTKAPFRLPTKATKKPTKPTLRPIKVTPRPIAKPTMKSVPSAKVSLVGSRSSTTKTSGKQGGKGKNALQTVITVTKGSATGTKVTANGFATNNAQALTLSGSKSAKTVTGTLMVAPKLAGANSQGTNSRAKGASMQFRLQKQTLGRRLSAACDFVPILVTAYYDMTCPQLNLVLASIGQPPSNTCTDPPGNRLFIASVTYNVSATITQNYTLPGSFDGFTSLDVTLLNTACGVLLIQNIDISISDGKIAVTRIPKKWSTGQIVTALGNNKIDVRSRTQQNTIDLGGQSSAIIKGISRTDVYDDNGSLLAVNLLVCKYSTFELVNVAINSDGSYSLADTFQIQDMDNTLVRPIKAICSSYSGTCKIQAFREDLVNGGGSIIILIFNSYDILARSSTSNPMPFDSHAMQGAQGGFDVESSDTIIYGSFDGFTSTATSDERDNREAARGGRGARAHQYDDNTPKQWSMSPWSAPGSSHGPAMGPTYDPNSEHTSNPTQYSDPGPQSGPTSSPDSSPESSPDSSPASSPAMAPSGSNGSPIGGPTGTSTSGVPLNGASFCSDVALDVTSTISNVRGERDAMTTVVTCGAEIIEYNGNSISKRTGSTETVDGSSWAAIVDVITPTGTVYNNLRSDYIAITSGGQVTTFQLRSTAAPKDVYSVNPTAGSGGIAVVLLPTTIQ